MSDKIIPLFHLKQDKLYLACDLNLSQSRKDRFVQILKTMQHDGTIAAIEKRYK